MPATNRAWLLILVCIAAIAAPPLTVLVTGDLCRSPAPTPGLDPAAVQEVAPGVYFRRAPTPSQEGLPFWEHPGFGGSNNVWVVFADYVVVIDANFPREAAEVIRAIRRTTDKPIRYVLDTHHHNDHCWGNGVFAREGASIVAQTNCARWLRDRGSREFENDLRSNGPAVRGHMAGETVLKPPDVVFDTRLVLDDGVQRVEFLFFGPAHTEGDAVAYLPGPGILCTGDACVNGPYEWMGECDSASWIRALKCMEQLHVRVVCPGHGSLGGKELLEQQEGFFVELRRQVQHGIDAGLDRDGIIKSINIPRYKEWTGVDAGTREDDINHVYEELKPRVAPRAPAECPRPR